MKKRLPRLRSDKAAEKFLMQDLSEYLHKDNFRKVRFEFEPKTESVSLRLSESLLKAIKKISKQKKMPYQRYIRLALEESVARKS